jgi:hypothetical protein
MRARSRDIGTTRSRSPAATGAACARGAAGWGLASPPLDFAAPPPFAASTARSTSSLSTRPSLPDPRIAPTSRPCSAISLRTAGIIGASLPAPALAAASAGEVSASSAFFGGAASAFFASAGSALAAAPAFAVSSMRAMTAPTATSAPCATTSSEMTPADGDGTFIVTLSVSSATRSWSASTCCPGFTSHSSTMASLIDSPRLGTFTSTAITTLPDQRCC